MDLELSTQTNFFLRLDNEKFLGGRCRHVMWGKEQKEQKKFFSDKYFDDNDYKEISRILTKHSGFDKNM